MLVLLVIFMIPFLHTRKAFDVHLPQPSTAGGEGVPIVLEVNPNGVYAIDQTPTTRSELASRLRAIYDGRPTKTILIRGHPDVRYQDVVSAIDVARGAGVVAVGVATHRPR